MSPMFRYAKCGDELLGVITEDIEIQHMMSMGVSETCTSNLCVACVLKATYHQPPDGMGGGMGYPISRQLDTMYLHVVYLFVCFAPRPS